jgi:Uma2 family endonuclease
MVAIIQQVPLTFEQFLMRYGDDDRYELIDGEVFDLEPTGQHEEVAAFIDRKLNVQIDRLELPYFIPQRCLIKPLGDWTGFRPDLVVLDRENLEKEPLWQQEPVITLEVQSRWWWKSLAVIGKTTMRGKSKIMQCWVFVNIGLLILLFWEACSSWERQNSQCFLFVN